MAKIAFVFAFRDDYHQTREMVHSLLLNSGSHYVELIGVGINADKASHSFLASVSRCHVHRLLYNCKLRVALDCGLRHAQSIKDLDYVAICHNDFVPSPGWLDKLEDCALPNRFYVPYSDHYGDIASYQYDSKVTRNDGGFCIIMPKTMAGRLLTLPCCLNQFNIDKWIFDTLGGAGMTCYKLAGSFAHHQRRSSLSQDEEVRKMREEDDRAYSNLVKWNKPYAQGYVVPASLPSSPSTSELSSVSVMADDGCPNCD